MGDRAAIPEHAFDRMKESAVSSGDTNTVELSAHAPVQFSLLGPFTVVGQEEPEVGSPTARALLVALLLRPTGYPTTPQLLTAVWGNSATISEETLYHWISKLRHQLAPANLHIGRGTRPAAVYRLIGADQPVDALQFRRLATSAATAANTDAAHALETLRHALALWRGPAAFPELRLAGIRAYGDALDAMRLAAEARLTDLEITIGDPERVVDRLRWLSIDHPQHPDLTAALIKALHTTGRSTEARLSYQQAVTRYGPLLPEKVRDAYLTGQA
jgi:DNA-binding SARP family transcriptional activator